MVDSELEINSILVFLGMNIGMVSVLFMYD